MLAFTVVSSAKRTNDKILLELIISLIYIRNNKGPRIEPCMGHAYISRFSEDEGVWFQEIKFSGSDIW